MEDYSILYTILLYDRCEILLHTVRMHTSHHMKKDVTCTFIFSEQDSDFDQQPYVLKAPADDSPINIRQVIDFVENFSMEPEEIRRTVGQLRWKIQMQRVVDSLFSVDNNQIL